MDEKWRKRFRRNVSQTQFIAYGFFCIILVGTLLLMLPFASRDGQSEPFLNCLFTATSASCVTGLVVRDTWTQWSLFGQLVILTMIQIGGLGFITVGVFISIVLRRKIGLKERGLLQESVNTLQIGGVVRLAKRIIKGTCIFEGVGAILLSIRFVPQFGILKGVFYGIFHSISAFCNAGFDLMGNQEPYSSFVSYYDDWLVNLVIMSLVIVGGIGFIVWDDVYKNRFHMNKYLLHTKIVLVTTTFLLFGGGLLFYLLERNNLLVGMNASGQILTSLFSSVTARTAGFNTSDTGALTDASKLLTIMLMFIGGSPGSTAGGIKTTTLFVLFICVYSNIKQTYGVNVFGRRIEEMAIKRAGTILSINLFLALSAALAIMALEPFGFSDILFETFSAIGTVGMTTGITRELHTLSRVIIIILMYCGRIGSLSFALAFVQSHRRAHIEQPAETINVG
ncbi:TrkH family potassium uptake protein [Clostridium sp. E02]|uniref:TrkH family potassium uptake protein n=1 Tax=Clostridium sp. E02 TaxID=2487134 RepID=UPI000F52DF99|nr:TrkH family potassium uptake protein [Clostridium sp. E02]